MAQTYWKKGKVNKMYVYFLTSSSLLFYWGFKIGISQTKDSGQVLCWENPDVTHIQIHQSFFIKKLSSRSTWEGLQWPWHCLDKKQCFGACQPTCQWIHGLRGHSKPYKPSTQPRKPFQYVSVAHSSFLLVFPTSITPSSFFFFLETNQTPKLPSSLHAYQTLSKRKCPINMEHMKKIWIPKWKAWEVPDLFTSLGSYLSLSLFLHPWYCCSFCGLFCVMIGNFSFSFFKLVRNFWMQPSFGGKRKRFLLVRETNKGQWCLQPLAQGSALGLSCQGTASGFWDLRLEGTLSGCQDFAGGGVVRREGEKEREMGVGFLKRPRNNGFCKSPGIQRGVFKDMSAFVPRGMSFMVN